MVFFVIFSFHETKKSLQHARIPSAATASTPNTFADVAQRMQGKLKCHMHAKLSYLAE
jgi:hypothetical protein